MATGSEYGGDPGLIQPEAKGHRIGANAADRQGVRDQAMLERMHGLREKAGLPTLSDADLRALLESGRDWQGRR